MLTGPPFLAALSAVLGNDNLAVQGVNNYLADVIGYLSGGSDWGSAYMAAAASEL